MSAQIKSVGLNLCIFAERNAFDAEKITFNPGITAYNRDESREKVTEDNSDNKIFLLSVNMMFDLMDNLPDSPFILTGSYCITYSSENVEDLSEEKLKDPIIIAHVIPYFRELVSSLTMRSNYPPLYFGAVNTFDLWGRFLEKQKKESISDHE